MSGRDDTPQDAAPERAQREYGHGSGDRNTVSPLQPEKPKEFEGGTQRRGDPDVPGEGVGSD
ncbi:MAG TPA: hypothetical protein VLK29_01035 [Luteimonas sp.]|nr:hypothetical protein [Luteimonas sp.]